MQIDCSDELSAKLITTLGAEEKAVTNATALVVPSVMADSSPLLTTSSDGSMSKLAAAIKR